MWGSIERNLPTPVLSDGNTNTFIFDIYKLFHNNRKVTQ